MDHSLEYRMITLKTSKERMVIDKEDKIYELNFKGENWVQEDFETQEVAIELVESTTSYFNLEKADCNWEEDYSNIYYLYKYINEEKYVVTKRPNATKNSVEEVIVVGDLDYILGNYEFDI